MSKIVETEENTYVDGEISLSVKAKVEVKLYGTSAALLINGNEIQHVNADEMDLDERIEELLSYVGLDDMADAFISKLESA